MKEVAGDEQNHAESLGEGRSKEDSKRQRIDEMSSELPPQNDKVDDRELKDDDPEPTLRPSLSELTGESCVLTFLISRQSLVLTFLLLGRELSLLYL